MSFWKAFGLMQIAGMPVAVIAQNYGNPPIFGTIGNQVFWLVLSAFVAYCAAENMKGVTE